MTKPIDTSRREFLRNASLLSVASSISTPFALNLFAMNSAFAATANDYKALVCLYLAGGNDSANMVLATDEPSWAGYLAARGGSNNIMPTGTLLSITPNPTPGIAGRTLALHPNMEGMKTLFDESRAAIIANVGTLIDPIANTSEYRGNTRRKPSNLFSHSDQTTQWLTANPDSPYFGWAGRMADQHAASNNNSPFANISLSGNSIFLAGDTVNQYQLGSNGAPTRIEGMTNLFGTSNNPLESIITNANGTGTASNVFEKDHAAVVKRSIVAQAALRAAMTSTTVAATTQYTNIWGGLSNNPLADQLQTVARIIAANSVLNVKRQVFFVNMGGFDTHNGQRDSHGDLMARLAHAVKYFDDALRLIPNANGIGYLSDQVTLFTASDFGRTFASNGSGTDHGWGGHHFVVGGAVVGKTVYGTFPPTCVHSEAHPNDFDAGSGALIPTTSVDQYAATLASWFGFTTNEITGLFPNLGQFSPPNLGFMKPG